MTGYHFLNSGLFNKDFMIYAFPIVFVSIIIYEIYEGIQKKKKKTE